MAALVAKGGPKAWGDDDDEGDDRETQDSNGIVERVKFSVNNKGQKIKTVTKVRISEVKVKTPKRADLRRNLPRFGDAKIGEENVTLPSRDFVSMEHPDDQLVEDVDDPSLAKTLANFIMKRQETKAAREMEDDDGEDFDRNASQEKKDVEGGAGKSDRYVPPGAKGAGSSSSGGMSSLEKLASTADTTTIRVSNLTKAVTEDDVHDLFKPFGRISRVSLPRLAGTKEPRGFAYVTFYSRDDAEKAMDTLQVLNTYFTSLFQQQDIYHKCIFCLFP